MPTHVATEPHYLYRFFGAGGTLLYIGITVSIPERVKKHSVDKPWWDGVANIAKENYPNRAAALEAEQRAIIAEHPLYNIVHNSAGSQWHSAPAGTGRAPELIPVCMGCKEQIHDDDGGALHISQPGVSAYQQWLSKRGGRWDDWDDFLESADRPPFPRWLVHCDGCNPHWVSDYDEGISVCDGCYAISTNEVRTWAQLTWWTSHLAEKRWLEHTNWFSFLRTIATGAEDAAFVQEVRR